MFHLYSSNRVERLTERLAGLLKEPLGDPLAAEHILVHSHGLERWLSLQLASSLGVCAHVEFPFPVPYLTQFMVGNTPGWDEHRASLLDRDALTWILMEVLPRVAEAPEAEALAQFFAESNVSSDLRCYQLAQRVALLFERYQLYRPHLLKRWLSGRVMDEEAWQASVWQAVIERTGNYHRLALKDSFLKHLQSTRAEDLEDLPPRLILFGLSSLAPYFVDVIGALSAFTEIHLFFLNPCEEYWGDILSRKQKARLSRRRRGSSSTSEKSDWDQLDLGLSAEPDFENELLAYFGKMGRDFFDLLLDIDGAVHEELHEPSKGTSALVALQSDVLRLQEGTVEIDREAEAEHPSLQVHSCHSPLREIEVLNDLLLDLFENDSSLRPRDIIVMAPRMETYTSKIHAVFHRPPSDERYIPYDIADRTPRMSHALSSAFLRLLALVESRWEVSDVLGVLECPPILHRYGLGDADLDRLRHWLAESGIRWGPDGEAKAALGLPATPENTWTFGLERLVLGHAMPSDQRETFSGVLPFDHIEGSDLALLNGFLLFWDHLRELTDRLSRPMTPERWASRLRSMIQQFLGDQAEDERELNFLYETLDQLGATAELARYEGTIELPVIRALLEEKLDVCRSAGGFLTGGVTFCNLLPMRSIPFRVVILLGLGARDFPRQDYQFAFDLMREKPVRGDRSQKYEDRYMFLEALLAAREKFIVFFTGQSLKDNSEMSPSIFVTQLRDYLDRVYDLTPASHTTVHRLQPFSEAYFTEGSEIFSYAHEYLEKPANESPVIEIDDFEAGRGLSPFDQKKSVTVEELIGFLQHPVASFYQGKFHLYAPRFEEEGPDIEPVSLNALETWRLDQWILELVEAELPTAEIGQLIKGSGWLPHGAHGESEMQHLLRGVQVFRDQMGPFLGGEPKPPVVVDMELGMWRLQGQIHGCREEGLRRVRFGRIRTQDRLRLWVEHLVLQSLGTQGQRSALLGRKMALVALQEFNTPHAAQHELKQLLELRDRGLQRPLPLFLTTSLVYAQQRRNRRSTTECLRRAYAEWRGQSTGPYQGLGEEHDYYHQLAFRHVSSPLDSEFMELSEKTMRPMLDLEQRNSG